MLREGSLAPPIELTDLNGDPWDLHSALKRGPVVLAFFKISCPTCQLTFPFLQRIADSGSLAAPQLVAISQDDAPSSRHFQARFGLSMLTLIDTTRTFPASNAYQITSVPSLFVVEVDGTVSSATEGFNKAALMNLGERFGVVPFHENDSVPALRPG
jgi:peroxiredoxin